MQIYTAGYTVGGDTQTEARKNCSQCTSKDSFSFLTVFFYWVLSHYNTVYNYMIENWVYTVAGNVGEEELSGRRQVEAVNGRRQMEGD